MKSLQRILFFGNYFYGICAVALSIEAGLQQQLGLNDPYYYALLFLGTVVYYTKAYLQAESDHAIHHPRADWYHKNAQKIRARQIVFVCLSAILLVKLILAPAHEISRLQIKDIFLTLIFPFVAIAYYGIENYGKQIIQLRRIGWLKPFIIGFCWAGAVSIYPAVYHHLTHPQHQSFTFFPILLFIKNFMFITVLCIMFDIKDYATDANQQLKTFVVTYGLRRTIFYIIIPLTILGLSAFLTYALTHHFSVGRIGLNFIPFLLILTVAFSLQKRRSIFFYLIIIDGLMLVKGLCGSLGMLFF